ncbi:hypothetical protein H1R20_g5545, partial [Candolleomyces eurysporus]
MQISTVNLIGHDQTVMSYENQSTDGDVLPADLRRVNFSLRNVRDTVIQWNRASVLLARQNEAERHSTRAPEGKKTPLDRRDVLNEIALAIFAEYQGHSTQEQQQEQQQASKLLSLIEGAGDQRLKLATSTIQSINGLAARWPARAIAQHIIRFFDFLCPEESTGCFEKFTTGDEIVDYIKAFHANFFDGPGSKLEGVLKSFCTGQGQVELSSNDIRQVCLLLAIVPAEETELSVAIVSALGIFSLPPEAIANGVRTSMKDNMVELFPSIQVKVEQISSASTANRKGKSSSARRSASSASARKRLSYKGKVLGIGKGTSKSFRWWNIVSDKRVDSPQAFSLAEAPNPGDLVCQWNPKMSTARAWLRRAGSWEDISTAYLTNDGSVVHPSFPLEGESRRILTYAHTGSRVPSYVLPKTYAKKLKVGFDVPDVDIEEEEEQEGEE